ESAASLGPSEAALLAGAIVNPRVLNPAHPTARLIRRQALIMRRMGSVTPPPPVDVVPAPPPADTVTPPGDEPPADPPPPDDSPQPVSPEDPLTDPNAVPQ